VPEKAPVFLLGLRNRLSRRFDRNGSQDLLAWRGKSSADFRGIRVGRGFDQHLNDAQVRDGILWADAASFP